MKLSSTLAGLVVATLFVGVSHNVANSQVLLDVDFDHYTESGLYTEDQLDDDFNNPPWEDGVREGRISIVTGAEAYGGTGASLAVSYPGGEYGTKGTGGQWKAYFDRSVEEAYMSFRIKFKKGFDFVRGGKIPGLGAGTAPTGSNLATGSNGWTTRMMWRTTFTGTSGQPQQLECGAISYAKYFQSGEDRDGDSDRTFWIDADDDRIVMKSDVWYKVLQRVKLNTPGQADGILEIWLDGELVHRQYDMVYRTVEGLEIDQMYFSTFYGGGSTWRTSKDEIVYSNPGDTVLVTKGDWPVGNLKIDKPVTVFGTPSTNLIATDSIDPVIEVHSANVQLKRLHVVGGDMGVWVRDNRVNVAMTFMDVTGAGSGIVTQSNCDNCQLRFCDINDCTDAGVRIVGSNDVLVSNSRSDGNGGTGIELSDCDEAFVVRSFARSNGETGINASGTNQIVRLSWASANGADGIVMSGQSPVLSENESRFNGGAGAVVHDSDSPMVLLNFFRRNSQSGLTGVAMSNGIIWENSFVANEGDGVTLLDSNSNRANRNSFLLNNFSGAWISPGSTSNLIFNNEILIANGQNSVLDEGSGNTVVNNSVEDQ